MKLNRTRLLAEYGPGGFAPVGLTMPVGVYGYPLIPMDPKKMAERLQNIARRRLRLREIALDWFKSPGSSSSASRAS